jgi:hypothetical protein
MHDEINPGVSRCLGGSQFPGMCVFISRRAGCSALCAPPPNTVKHLAALWDGLERHGVVRRCLVAPSTPKGNWLDPQSPPSRVAQKAPPPPYSPLFPSSSPSLFPVLSPRQTPPVTVCLSRRFFLNDALLARGRDVSPPSH